MSFRSKALSAVLALSVAAISSSQTPPPAAPAQAAAAAQTPAAKPAPKPGELKKYDEVITKEAVSDEGVFKVHTIGDKVYWEIPADKIGREFLWQTEIAKLPRAVGYPGTAVGVRVVRFGRRNNKLFLRDVDSSSRATGNDPGVLEGLYLNTVEPILSSLDIQTEGPNKSVVVDVTSWFTSDPSDFAVRGAVGGAGVDPGRSYIERVRSFPKNVETRSFLTLQRGGARANSPFGGGGNFSASAISITVHYSLVELPEKPILGRLKDTRVGYFTNDFVEFGGKDGKAKPVSYINRFRLEKKDPKAAVSEPKEPITYYVAREVPERWRKWIKEGIEMWKPAFEKAGFKNGIIAKDAPTVKEDPDWDPEDARYSVIRWAPSETQNAMGPSIQDPRSGETISAHVIMWNDIVRLLENWYFSQAAATDPRAAKLPFNDDLLGQLVRYVTAHEVGHTLGLEHNFKASVAYTTKQLRDPAFTEKNGVAASIMSYSRYNYVAQPGDGVKPQLGQLGPYDHFAIEYGYKPLPGANSPEDEKPALDAFLSKQIKDPSLRFGNYLYSGIDPTTQSENISNDPVEAARLGLKNIEWITKNLLLTSTTKFGETYEDLAEKHSTLVGQRLTELFHIIPLVGGVVEIDAHAGRGDGDIFKPVPAAKQAEAVKFLTTVGLDTPGSLIDPKFTNKVGPSGTLSLGVQSANRILTALLNESRVRRLIDQELTLGSKAYTVTRLFGDVTTGVWSELASPSVAISAFRRDIQRTYLRTVDGRVNGSGATRTDLKPIALAGLRQLAKAIDKALPNAKDALTAGHLAQSRKEIELIITNKYSTPGAAAPFNILDFLLGGVTLDSALEHGHRDCWQQHLPEALQEVLRDLKLPGTKPNEN